MKQYNHLPSISKQNAFTSIRIICALIVVYEHFIVLTNVALINLGLRGIAVNIFFFLSGFWVTRSFFTSKSLTEFYKKRIKKIFPAYLAVVFTAAILLVCMSTLDVSSYFTNSGFWKYLAANISTLNFVHPDLPGVFNGDPVNGSLWTIKVELGFYIILPLIVLLCIGKSKSSGGGYRCLVILSVVYLLSGLYVILTPLFTKKYDIPPSVAHQLPAYMGYFATGMIIFFYFEKVEVVLNKLMIAAFPILVLCIVFKNIYISAFFEPAALGIVVMWIALKAKPLFVFSKCYDFSYWLYLIHYPIIMVIKEFIC